MIVEPPGEPTASSGLPSRSTIVGLIELRGRLPPSTRFGCVSESKLKSVSSLFARNPKPGTTRPAPPVDSIVNVYATTLPQRSAVVRCVVVPARVSLAEAWPLALTAARCTDTDRRARPGSSLLFP